MKRTVKETFAYLHEVDGKEMQSLKSFPQNDFCACSEGCNARKEGCIASDGNSMGRDDIFLGIKAQAGFRPPHFSCF
jgi:hypothetical protein